jgi:hypothetical protein
LAAKAGEEMAKTAERIARADGIDFTAVCGDVAMISTEVDKCHRKRK